MPRKYVKRKNPVGQPPKYLIGKEYNRWRLLDRYYVRPNKSVYLVKCSICGELRNTYCITTAVCECRKRNHVLRLNRDIIAKMLTKGASYAEIAKRLGVDTTVLYSFCRENDMTRLKLKKLTVDSVKKLLAKGLCIKDLAKSLGLSENYVSRFCRQHNIAYSARTGRRDTFCQTDVARLTKLWIKFKNVSKVAQELGCCDATAKKYLKRFAILNQD